jgi:hypothetical protein
LSAPLIILVSIFFMSVLLPFKHHSDTGLLATRKRSFTGSFGPVAVDLTAESAFSNLLLSPDETSSTIDAAAALRLASCLRLKILRGMSQCCVLVRQHDLPAYYQCQDCETSYSAANCCTDFVSYGTSQNLDKTKHRADTYQ